MNHHGDTVWTMKTLGDTLSIVIAGGSLASILPPIAAVLSIIWTLIRIYETKTIQRLLGKR